MKIKRTYDGDMLCFSCLAVAPMPAALAQPPPVWSGVAGYWPPVPVGAPGLVDGQPRLARR